MLTPGVVFLAHGGGAGPAWLAWLPHVVALGLAVGVSLATDRLWRSPTFGDGTVRRFGTLAGLVLVASLLGLGLFWATDQFLVH